MHYKSYRVRIYPNKKQEELIWKHIGASRFIWNYMLDLQQERYKNGEKHLSAYDMSYLIKSLRQEHEWLQEVATNSLYRVCADLANSYQRFFKGISGYPSYKSRKRSKHAYPFRNEGLYFKGKVAVLEILGKVKYKSDYKFPQGRGHKYSDVRLHFDNGKYMLSFVVECENQAPIELTDKPMGIDLGIKELAVVAFGDEQIIFHNINKSKKMRDIDKRIKHGQRSLSRKYLASMKRNGGKCIKTNNIVKEEKKVAKLQRRTSNIRNNYIHQTTHDLTSMLPKQVVMEKLNVSGMMKNKHLSRAIEYQAFSKFIIRIKYKCEWKGIRFIQADRFYPSSKKCSNCGEIKKDLKLKDRTYVCPHCGFRIDRDYNAAINLMRYEA